MNKTITGSQPGFTVPVGDVYTVSGTVTTSADVVVHGILQMRAGSTLKFTAGMLHVPDGVLDIAGTPKTAWTADGSRPWPATDEVVYMPTKPGVYVASTTPTGGEALNLTRDVTIESPTRIQIESSKPQTIRYATVLNAGISNQIGFYPIHFHHGDDGTRGSLLEGVVVRGGKHHAYAIHGSHGVTLKDCIAYDTIGDPYWWDLPPNNTDESNNTDDALWDRCVAAFAKPGAITAPRELAGFLMGAGSGNKCIGCLAVGIGKTPNSSGFHWPSQVNSHPNTWIFEDCVAHNNLIQGIFVWQNTKTTPHFLDRFRTYANGLRSVAHGAYNVRGYHYRDCVFDGDFFQHAHLGQTNNLTLGEIPSVEDSTFNSTLVLFKHTVAGVLTLSGVTTDAFRYIGCTFNGTPKVKVDDASQLNGSYGFIDCNLEPADFHIKAIHPSSRIRVQRLDGTAFQITAGGVKTIGAFA